MNQIIVNLMEEPMEIPQETIEDDCFFTITRKKYTFCDKPNGKVHNRMFVKEEVFIKENFNLSREDAAIFKKDVTSQKNELEFRCQFCNKSFKKSAELTVHLMSHSEKNRKNSWEFKCNFCDKSFQKASVLAVHLRNHTGVAPYQCQLCEKSFKWPHLLKLHWMDHTGVRPYGCTFCTRRFKQSSDRNMHLKTHKKEVKSEQQLL